MYGIIITTIICVTILIFVGIAYNFKNPFVDEIFEKSSLLDEDEFSIGCIILYKRTYNNGKVKYIRKIYYN